MSFPAPRYPKDHPDRDLACQEQLDLRMLELVDIAVAAGWDAPEVFNALEEVIRNQRCAFEEDPNRQGKPTEALIWPINMMT